MRPASFFDGMTTVTVADVTLSGRGRRLTEEQKQHQKLTSIGGLVERRQELSSVLA
jgi:hypothetical protein